MIEKIEFPDVEAADENGLLAISFELDIDYLVAAYRKGIFPWPVDEEHILWFAPPRRAILRFKNLQVNKRLERQLKNSDFQFRVNEDFAMVINACSSVPRGGQPGTWINRKIIEAYIKFHQAGYACSFETVNSKGELVGGMYGVRMGSYFAGESMFFRESGASKFALINAVDYFQEQGMSWIDVQVLNPFLQRFGAEEVSRGKFTKLLENELEKSI